MARRTIITGAGSGIGLASVRRCLDLGDHVVAVVHSEKSAEETRAALTGIGSLEVAVADVGDAEQLGPLFAQAADLLIASAGICRQARLDEANSDQVWQETMRVNLHGVYHCIRLAAANMRERGNIIAISSGLGKNARAGYEAYCASKHAVLGLVKCCALELAPRGIRVNAVCPGWVDTPMSRADSAAAARRAGVDVETFRAQAIAGIPLGRMVSAEEVAGLIAFLASEEASAITGQAYNISCGEFFN